MTTCARGRAGEREEGREREKVSERETVPAGERERNRDDVVYYSTSKLARTNSLSGLTHESER